MIACRQEGEVPQRPLVRPFRFSKGVLLASLSNLLRRNGNKAGCIAQLSGFGVLSTGMLGPQATPIPKGL
eukprot:251374-Amphidinium_carterae.2